MRFLLSVIIIAFIGFSSLYSEDFIVDERKIDLYYANGILGLSYEEEWDDWNVQVAVYIQDTSLVEERFIGKADVAFNTSYGAVTDLFESFLQKSDEDPSVKVTWLAFQGFVGRYFSVAAYAVKLDEAVVNEYRTKDLTKQIDQYKKSISLGHGVIAVTHSQGNLFVTKLQENRML